MDLLDNTTILLLFSLCCLLLLAIQRKGTKNKNVPPGPTPLPFIGNLLQLNFKNLAGSLKKMSEKYGPVFTVHFGSEPVVVLHGYETVKEALVERGDQFVHRGSLPLVDKTNKGLGILMSSGERWVQLRRFSLATLRNFGMGKKSIEEQIQEEATHLMKELRAKKGQPFDPASLLSCASCNVISHILLGERFSYQDQEYLEVLHMLTESFRLENSVAGQLYGLFPSIMEYLPGSHQTYFKNLFAIQAFVAKKVKEHERNVDPNAPRDFVDAFLLKMEQERSNAKTEFTRENLNMTVYDLFIAGTETTSITLRYILMVLTEYPAVQAKVRQEVDQVIGQERPPAMKDRPQMPFTEAVLHEAQRCLDLVPLGLVRMVKQDTEIQGFAIPKGTSIFTVLSSALHDHGQFKNPYQFDPEHFLDENGAFKKNGADMPFSAGKRNCVGEGLARMELFLYLTTILQSFYLKRPPGVTKIDVTPALSGIGNIPPPVLLCLSPR
ncbi:cytochrome P450 2C23-like [Tiliqua scincoides]|uniref:cytochrome P450 2C23-like n=1 Tax=Tiliqua scincoides TaxID=71010 RepID=UPI003462A58A